MSLPLERSKPSIKVFDDEYDRAYLDGMRRKVGATSRLQSVGPSGYVAVLSY